MKPGAPKSLGRYFPYRLKHPIPKPTGEISVIRFAEGGGVESWDCHENDWHPGTYPFLGNVDQASEMASLLGGFVLYSELPAPLNPLVEDAVE